MDEQAVEYEIQQKGLTAPRVTAEVVERQIVSEDYYQWPGTTVISCRLGLKNGFSVLGMSACVATENFDEELGRRIAYDDARNKIWALEGYLLRSHLSNTAICTPDHFE